MNTFIKNNWFKLILASAVLVITISVAYYFIIFLPKQNEQNREFSLQQKCQEAGEKIYNEEHSEAEKYGLSSARYKMLLNPLYGFNNKLNTCLYSYTLITGNTETGGVITDYRVRDALSNKNILGITVLKSKESEDKIIGPIGGVKTVKEFFSREEELFNQ